VFIPVLVRLSAVIPSGCQLFTGTESASSSRIKAELALPDDPLHGKPVDLAFRFASDKRSPFDADNATARIGLPEGFSLVDTDL